MRQTGRLTLCLGPENRWCAHVQRPHKSNGTYLSVDRRRGSFAQYCFDPDCRAAGFRGSDELPVPPDLCVLAADELPPPPPSPPRCTFSFADQFPEEIVAEEAMATSPPAPSPSYEQAPSDEYPPQPLPLPGDSRQMRQLTLHMPRMRAPAAPVHQPSKLPLIPAIPSSPPVPPPLPQRSCGQLPPSPQPSSKQDEACLKTPSIGEGAREAMQSTPKSTPKIGAGVGILGVGADQLRDQLKENVSSNEAQQPSYPWRSSRSQREERRPADVGRTPLREEATPIRGREHPASTPSPIYSGTGSMHDLGLADQEQGRMAQHEMSCGLFGSPLLFDTLDSHAEEPGNEQMQDASADPWACAACTLINASDATRCVVCDALKGSTLAAAATLALQGVRHEDTRSAPSAKTNRAGGSSTTAIRPSAGRTAQQLGRGQTDITQFFSARP